ncbi:glutaredoxin family protein [Ferrimonas lipolytica]|uniref:Glutaredoxin domain-containing protein n=1 Tax=Ferrimonas lipolytica TaxID=2724191 RepID=A0A6H1UHJ7_9GAMM|nr:glutaredoxin domain-containing protein [Ferrimonas lipolytica]QIZ78585.1 hypothetical protein HER31_17765 [Ferrimonas lipolytica]
MNKRVKWSVFAVVVVLFGFAGYQLSAAGRYANQMQAKYDSEVLLYSASWCSVCASARRYFARNDIDYVEIDVETDTSNNDEFRQLGGLGVPLIVVKGKVMRGFEPNRISEWVSEPN